MHVIKHINIGVTSFIIIVIFLLKKYVIDYAENLIKHNSVKKIKKYKSKRKSGMYDKSSDEVVKKQWQTVVIYLCLQLVRWQHNSRPSMFCLQTNTRVNLYYEYGFVLR